MPPRFLVRGGRPLHGTVRPAGNNNSALPILASTVLADGPMDLDNIPRTRKERMRLPYAPFGLQPPRP